MKKHDKRTLWLPALFAAAIGRARGDLGTRYRATRVILASLVLPIACWGLDVASLHPLMADLARQVGQDRVTVVELIGPDDNPHEFDPSPQTLRAASSATLILASGKGLESSYLHKLRDGLGPDQEIFEVGRRVHSLVAADGNPAPCCDHHGHTGVVDPHWWHDPDNMRRAASELAEKLGELDPANAEFYQANARSYRESLETLDGWIQSRIAEIPPSRRILATSHLAYGYFCRKYNFTAVGIQGLNREDSPSLRAMGEIILYLREEQVPVLFPEIGSNPKALQAVASEAGISLAGPLYPDGNGLPPGEGYEYMMRSNVNTIVDGIRGASPQ